MSVVGIIAEFNPLHTGHKRIIDHAHTLGDTVACVISGNFVQRGDVGILSKLQRAKFALLCGADIVAEMPVLWSMSTAQNFALCGVWQLYNIGCDKILFGSECGDINALKAAADVLNSDGFFNKVTDKAKSGVTFAVAREQAAQEMGVDFTLLRNPNDNLGIEYILAAKKLNLPIEFHCIKRLGAMHDSGKVADGFVSSSFIREELYKGNIGYTERFMPREIRGIIRPEHIADISRIENAILCSLRTKTADDFKNLPDISEGLHNKIYFSARVATNLDELYNMIKTKRYTLARIRRLVLSMEALDAMTVNRNKDMVEFITALETKMPSSFSLSDLTATANGITMNVTVATKEETAVVLNELRKLECFSFVDTTSVSELITEIGETQYSFSVEMVYAPIEEETEEGGE